MYVNIFLIFSKNFSYIFLLKKEQILQSCTNKSIPNKNGEQQVKIGSKNN